MSYRAAAGIVAALVLAVGIFLGASPHSITDWQGKPSDCGSAFAPSQTNALAHELAIEHGSDGADPFALQAQECADTLSTPRITAWALIGVGAVAGLFVLLISGRSRKPQESAA